MSNPIDLIQYSDECHVIVVGGAARSGTTLMQAILCSDQDTNPLLSEAAPLQILVDAYRRTLTHVNAYPDMYFSSRDEVQNLYETYMRCFINKFASKYDVNYCIWKMPALTSELPILSDIIPNFHMICMIRDPRDIITSMMHVAEKKRSHNEDHPWTKFSIEDFSQLCLSYYDKLISEKLKSTYREKTWFVRYEDLANDPEEVISDIRNFTGLQLHEFSRSSEWSSIKFNLDVKTSPARDFLTPLYGGPIDNSKIGTWKQHLTHTDVSTIERICRPLMTRFGYFNE